MLLARVVESSSPSNSCTLSCAKNKVLQRIEDPARISRPSGQADCPVTAARCRGEKTTRRMMPRARNSASSKDIPRSKVHAANHGNAQGSCSSAQAGKRGKEGRKIKTIQIVGGAKISVNTTKAGRAMRWMRRSLNPRQSKTELEAVLLLQRTWRGRLARRRAVKRQMLYLKRRANRERAATEAEMASRVQALWRGRRLRRQAYERRMLAATGFQTIWRLYHARQQYKALVVDYRSLRNGAAMTIQRRWRTRSERNHFFNAENLRPQKATAPCTACAKTFTWIR